MRPRAIARTRRASRNDESRSFMRKQVLVSVDRGETRVAILERQGRPPRSERTRRGRASRSRRRRLGLARRRALHRAPRPALDRRQHLQGPGGQRPVRHGGRVRRHRRSRRTASSTSTRSSPPDGQTQRRGRGRGGGPRISELLKSGQEVSCRSTKDPIGTKGARLTMEISIPGRYLVYVPNGEGVGVSRRLPDSERERLRKLASNLKLEQRRR